MKDCDTWDLHLRAAEEISAECFFGYMYEIKEMRAKGCPDSPFMDDESENLSNPRNSE